MKLRLERIGGNKKIRFSFHSTAFSQYDNSNKPKHHCRGRSQEK
jgi:hypothetical protein